MYGKLEKEIDIRICSANKVFYSNTKMTFAYKRKEIINKMFKTVYLPT